MMTPKERAAMPVAWVYPTEEQIMAQTGYVDMNHDDFRDFYLVVNLCKQLNSAPVQQKPVACIIHTEEGDYVDWNSKGYCFYIGETPLYAAPVRTKNLTDDEIEAIMVEQGDLRTTAFARAVIQADREKNK